MKKNLILKLIESNDISNSNDICITNLGKLFIYDSNVQYPFSYKLIKPIAISDEEIKASCIFLNLENNQVVKLTKENEFGFVFRDSFKKIELLPDHFSPTIKQAIVDGKLKDGDSIEVEYPLIDFDNPKLDSNNHAIISIPESKESIMYSEEEVINYITKLMHQVLDARSDVVYNSTEFKLSPRKWFELNR